MDNSHWPTSRDFPNFSEASTPLGRWARIESKSLSTEAELRAQFAAPPPGHGVQRLVRIGLLVISVVWTARSRREKTPPVPTQPASLHAFAGDKVDNRP